MLLDEELIGDAGRLAASALVHSGEIDGVTILAIGLGGGTTEQLTCKRARHLTFAPDALAKVGIPFGGEAEKLLALIDSELSGETCAGAIGFSLSGSFLMQAASRIGSFPNHLVALSPSLWAEPAAEDAARQWLSRSDANRLKLVVGGEEKDRELTGDTLHMHERVERLGARLEQRFGSRSRLSVLPEETHYTTPIAAMPAALRWILRD